MKPMTRSRQKQPPPEAPAAPPEPAPAPPALTGLDYFKLAQQITDENVWHWDLTRGTLHWSPQTASLLGITKSISVLSGDPFQTFLHPDDLGRATAAIQAHLKRGTPYCLEERLLTRNGFVWFLVRGKAFRNEEGRPVHMTGYLTDIHRLRQEAVDREKELVETRDLAKELMVLNELSRALTSRLSVKEVAQETYRQASRLLDTRNFAMSLYNPAKGEHEFILNLTESAVDREALTRQPANLGISGYIIHNRIPVLIKDNADRWAASLGVQPVGDCARSWLGVPLLLDQQVLGVVIVQNYHQENVYDEHDRDLLTTIASSAAVALQNALLFSEKRQAGLASARRDDEIRQRVASLLDAAVRLPEAASAERNAILRNAEEILRNLP